MKFLLRRFRSWRLIAPLTAGRYALRSLPALRVMRRQLTEAAAEAEQSVGSVCESFSGMSQRAGQAVESSRAVLAGSGTDAPSVQELIANTRRTLTALLLRMEQTSELTLAVSRRIDSLLTTVAQVSKAVSEIDDIAFHNKVLALNAKIEAVHVGERGAGFELVAEQISRQAYRSTELTNGIEQLVHSLQQAVQETSTQLHSIANEDRTRCADSRAEVQFTLDNLEREHDRILRAVESSGSESRRLAEDISRAVVGLQFQDRLNQRIGHVVDSLLHLEGALGGGEDEAVESHLVRSYTMQSERDAAASVSRVKPSQPVPDVELF